MWPTSSKPVENAMALGGVATGSMKAKEHDMQPGMINNMGWMPMSCPTTHCERERAVFPRIPSPTPVQAVFRLCSGCVQAVFRLCSGCVQAVFMHLAHGGQNGKHNRRGRDIACELGGDGTGSRIEVTRQLLPYMDVESVGELRPRWRE